MKKLTTFSTGLLFLLSMMSVTMAQSHLLISEFVVTPTAGEFIEIYNGTGDTVDLSNYYLTDAIYKNDNDYVNLVDGTYTPEEATDFLARFPSGATIANGEYLVIAVDGTGFNTTYSFDADFELKGTSATTPDLVAPGANYIGSNVGITNAGEVLILFYWDGASDLIQDVDYVVWGDKEEAVDKTGVQKDGPDADTDATTYLNDTAITAQISASSSTPHGFGKSMARRSLNEANEKTSGGNGITGHDETSEDLAAAFMEADLSPGEKTVSYVNVTFLCNTAAWQDTLFANSLVHIRGTLITEAGQAVDDVTIDTLSPGTILTWNGMSQMYLDNVEGDYWKGTFRIPAGIRMAYKFFLNASHDSVYPGAEWEHAGWERNITTPAWVYPGNRGLDLSNFAGSDTTLPLQFANGWKDPLGDQFEKPYQTQPNSFIVYVRVNMIGWEEFSPLNHVVGIRGANKSDNQKTGEISWNETYPMKREGAAGVAGAFYSTAIHVPEQYATAGLSFKFVVHKTGNPLDELWDNMAYNPNVQYDVTTTGKDTTVYWKWFDNLNLKPAEHPDRIRVYYIVDVRNAVADRGFTLGDTLQVQTGFNQTASQRNDLYLKRQGTGTIYQGNHYIQSMKGRELYYQYYSRIKGSSYREVYFNFQYPDKANPVAERRAFTPDSTVITIADTGSSISDPRRMPRFRNVQVIAQDSLLVTLECDVRPAIYQLKAGAILEDIQGFVDVTHPDSVLAWGVAVNGPLTGGWSSPGGDWGRHLMSIPHKAMHDDGLNGDRVKGDSIFTILFKMYRGKATQVNGPTNIIGQEFKFGIGGGDNEGGFGNNHIVNIDDSQPQYTIYAQFGSIDPLFYSAWDFDKRGPATGVDIAENTTIPDKFRLEQNYPNPFNPTTIIKYSLPKEVDVTLKLFNMRGQEVKTLVSKKQLAGIYAVEWDGRDNSGIAVSTGIYFYRIQAGKFTRTNKMLLVK